jgi:serine phosphatase RsbU (regulator of sigma subunit)/tetratricopeptide (TPR) repeat protein
MKLLPACFAFLLCSSQFSFTQTPDSIDLRFNSLPENAAKVDSLCAIGWEIKFEDLGRAFDLFLLAEQLADSLDYSYGKGNAQNRLGSIYYMVGIADTAMLYYRSSLQIFKELKDLDKIGTLYLNMGNVFDFTGESDSSFNYTVKSLKIFKELNDKAAQSLAIGNLGNYYQKRGVFEKAIEYYIQELRVEDSLEMTSDKASTYNNIGTVNWQMMKYESALEYFHKANRIWLMDNNYYYLGPSYLNLGGVHQDMGNLDSARYYAIKALKISSETGDVNTESKVLNNLGILFEKLGELDSSEIFHKKALKVYGELGNLSGECSAMLNLSSLYESAGKFKKALTMIDRGIEIGLKIENYRILAKFYHNKAGLLLKLKRYKESTANFALYINGWDSIQSHQVLEATQEMQVRYETEEKDLMITNLNQENELKSALVDKKQLEIEQGQILRNFLGLGVVLLILAVAGFYRSFRIKKKANSEIREKNEELNTQNEEIMAQRDQLESQNIMIWEKNKQITDSINYAERIQKAMLPSGEKILSLLPDHFILFKPRDIVSGDFFWIGETKSSIILSVADCTGHGVPGAFMSMIGMELLNRIVTMEGIDDPGLILERLHEGINKALEQETSELRDGMDMVLCSLNRTNGEIKFAGAKNSLIYIQERQLKVIKGDKFPIGGHEEEGKRKFTTHILEKSGSSLLYLFSDGIQDQFGGPTGKKYMIRRLVEFLQSISNLDLETQNQKLGEELDSWMGDQEQLDDICLLAVRI